MRPLIEAKMVAYKVVDRKTITPETNADFFRNGINALRLTTWEGQGLGAVPSDTLINIGTS